MIWIMVFCAWGIKSGGCVSPAQFTSKASCEFVLQHQRNAARVAEREWGGYGISMSGRCVGVRK